jgi:hypothetical protein
VGQSGFAGAIRAESPIPGSKPERLLSGARRIADVAVASGFHDQAHMVREWHALAGCSPREWIFGQLPFLQDYEIGGGHD